MFWNCSSLTAAPELPAMELAEYCYDRMFPGGLSQQWAADSAANVMTLAGSANGVAQVECTPYLRSEATGVKIVGETSVLAL